MDFIHSILAYLPEGVTKNDLVDYAIVIVIGAIGGLCRELVLYYDQGISTSFKEIITRMFIGAFAGLMTAEIAQIMLQSNSWTWVASGLGAYSGVEMLNKVSAIFESKLDSQASSEGLEVKETLTTNS